MAIVNRGVSADPADIPLPADSGLPPVAEHPASATITALAPATAVNLCACRRGLVDDAALDLVMALLLVVWVWRGAVG
jgi:hypothetical protein